MAIYTQQSKDSSFIKSVAWNSKSMILIVNFKSGSVWAYYRVPKKVYQSLISSSSMGNYFNISIRDIYSCERLSFASENSGSVSIGQKAEQKEEIQLQE